MSCFHIRIFEWKKFIIVGTRKMHYSLHFDNYFLNELFFILHLKLTSTFREFSYVSKKPRLKGQTQRMSRVSLNPINENNNLWIERILKGQLISLTCLSFWFRHVTQKQEQVNYLKGWTGDFASGEECPFSLSASNSKGRNCKKFIFFLKREKLSNIFHKQQVTNSTQLHSVFLCMIRGLCLLISTV